MAGRPNNNKNFVLKQAMKNYGITDKTEMR